MTVPDTFEPSGCRRFGAGNRLDPERMAQQGRYGGPRPRDMIYGRRRAPMRSSKEPLDVRGMSAGWTLHDLNEVAVRIAHEADS